MADPNTPNSIELSITLQFQDYLKALFWHIYWKQKTRWFFIVFILLLAILIHSQGVAIFLVIFLVVYPAVIYLSAEKSWQSNNSVQQHAQYTFSKTDVKIESETFHHRTEWINIYAAYEHANSFLIYSSRRTFFLIPKKFFSNQPQLEAFRSLLKSALGAKAHFDN